MSTIPGGYGNHLLGGAYTYLFITFFLTNSTRVEGKLWQILFEETLIKVMTILVFNLLEQCIFNSIGTFNSA